MPLQMLFFIEDLNILVERTTPRIFHYWISRKTETLEMGSFVSDNISNACDYAQRRAEQIAGGIPDGNQLGG